jgi:hypothetical protein
VKTVPVKAKFTIDLSAVPPERPDVLARRRPLRRHRWAISGFLAPFRHGRLVIAVNEDEAARGKSKHSLPPGP